jgi:tRNA pseudouridine38-40 synthase
MNLAAQALVGEHDFRAFSQDLDPSQVNTVRKLYSVEVTRAGNEVRIDIAGTAFIRGMMRRIAGGLMEIGRGRRPASDIATLLSNSRNQVHWPEVLPAKGLTLMRITYGRHPRDHRTALEDELNE